MVFNIMAMGVNGPFAFIVFAAALFPGVNMALDQIAAVPLVLIVAFTYTFLAVSMPRAGADYVWLSRSLHPGVGFLESFGLVALWISVFGATAPAWFPAGIGGMIINWGTLTGNSGLVNYASTVLSPFNMFAIILAIMIVTMLLNLAGTKVLFRFIEACFVGSVLGVIIFLGAFLALGHNAFVTNFNQVSSTSYANVVNAAQSAGYETGFTVSGTAYGAIYAFLTYFGFAWSSFFAGEMKEVYRSQIIAIIGGLLVFAFITWATYQVAYVVIGAPFINGASYLAETGNSAWVLPSAPYLSYLIIFATNNPWIAIIMPFSIMAGAVGYLAAYFGQAIRVIFAWSFDRLLPTAFSNIDQRFHAPRNAILLIAVATLPFMYMGCYTGLLNFLTYASLQLWITAAIVGVGAAVFPYRRKDIFDKAPKIVRTMVGRVPLMTVLGAVTAIVSVVVSAFSALPALTGAPITPSYLLVVVGIFVFGGV
jgi:amino acid transporter